MRVVLLRSAIRDLIRGHEFYEKQGEGLGDYFEASLTAEVESLRLYAGVHPIVYGYHRMLSSSFPYAVYYDFTTGCGPGTIVPGWCIGGRRAVSGKP